MNEHRYSPTTLSPIIDAFAPIVTLPDIHQPVSPSEIVVFTVPLTQKNPSGDKQTMQDVIESSTAPQVHKKRLSRYMPTEKDYRVDGEPRPVYYHQYRETLERIRRLEEAGIIRIGEVLPGDISILFIGNNTVLPETFDLRNQDRQPIGEFPYPGKSATIKFTEDRDVACEAIHTRSARRDKHTDFLYDATSRELEEIGFHAYYTPLPNNPLHVRIVHDIHRQQQNEWTTPYKARLALAGLLQKNRISS